MSLCVVQQVLCALIFVAYDWLMQSDLLLKTAILENKRQFVRFMSHEIRTPLNTVQMGISLVNTEINDALIRLTSYFDTSACDACNTVNATGFDSDGSSSAKEMSADGDADHTNCAVTISQNELLQSLGATLRDLLSLTSEILSNNLTAVEVLDDLLNYDKVEVGTLHLEFSTVNIAPLVQRVYSDFKLTSQHKSVVLKFKQAFTSSPSTDDIAHQYVNQPIPGESRYRSEYCC